MSSQLESNPNPNPKPTPKTKPKPKPKSKPKSKSKSKLNNNSITKSVRTQCIQCLLEVIQPVTGLSSTQKTRYAQELEYQIYRYTQEPKCLKNLQCAYYRQYNRILTILKLNPSIILSCLPIQLLMENDYNLVASAGIVNYLQQYQDEYKLYKKLLYQSEPTEQDVTSHITCPNKRCKNTKNFRIQLRQTRGADEPMTAFITCPQCNTQFRR